MIPFKLMTQGPGVPNAAGLISFGKVFAMLMCKFLPGLPPSPQKESLKSHTECDTNRTILNMFSSAIYPTDFFLMDYIF